MSDDSNGSTYKGKTGQQLLLDTEGEMRLAIAEGRGNEHMRALLVEVSAYLDAVLGRKKAGRDSRTGLQA